MTPSAIGGLAWSAATLALLGVWFVRRPELPGDEAQQTVRDMAGHKLLAAVTVVAGVGLGIGMPTAFYDPTRWWSWGLLAVGAIASVALLTLVTIGRRNYERAKEAA